jgi:hypothetical protein
MLPLVAADNPARKARSDLKARLAHLDRRDQKARKDSLASVARMGCLVRTGSRAQTVNLVLLALKDQKALPVRQARKANVARTAPAFSSKGLLPRSSIYPKTKVRVRFGS